MTMPHTCRCVKCGREMPFVEIHIPTAAAQPVTCEHEWGQFKEWNDASGLHGSKRCIKCGQYLQW